MIASRGSWVTPSTATVFCQVTAVIAVIPCTPHRANALRSAWMPAPPPESDPAIESTRGMRGFDIAEEHRRRLGAGRPAGTAAALSRAADVVPARAAPDQAEQL